MLSGTRTLAYPDHTIRETQDHLHILSRNMNAYPTAKQENECLPRPWKDNTHAYPGLGRTNTHDYPSLGRTTCKIIQTEKQEHEYLPKPSSPKQTVKHKQEVSL